jgi:hypothetical protein
MLDGLAALKLSRFASVRPGLGLHGVHPGVKDKLKSSRNEELHVLGQRIRQDGGDRNERVLPTVQLGPRLLYVTVSPAHQRPEESNNSSRAHANRIRSIDCQSESQGVLKEVYRDWALGRLSAGLLCPCSIGND